LYELTAILCYVEHIVLRKNGLLLHLILHHLYLGILFVECKTLGIGFLNKVLLLILDYMYKTETSTSLETSDLYIYLIEQFCLFKIHNFWKYIIVFKFWSLLLFCQIIVYVAASHLLLLVNFHLSNIAQHRITSICVLNFRTYFLSIYIFFLYSCMYTCLLLLINSILV